MSLIESCFNELKFSLSNSMLGRNIEIQYHLQRNDFSSRNANPNVDLETLDNNLRLPNNDNNPSPMTVETPIFPQSIDHES